jgi:glycosyltransferase involved in cell wall biosynthesis
MVSRWPDRLGIVRPVEVEISAVVLGYRAGQSLVRVLEPLHELLTAEGAPFELVVVANYWPDRDDGTADVARRFAATHESTIVVARPKEGAMGWDVRSGFAATSGRYVIFIDGDEQNPVDDVLRMYRAMRASGAAVMKGRRELRHDGAYRRLVSLTYNAAFRVLFRTRGLWDINGKPKGLTREAYERLDLRSDDWFIDAEIVLKARELGLYVAELPVEFMRNDRRASLVRPRAIWEFAVNMFRERFRQ